MPEYRIYIVGDDGHFRSSISLPNCPDDEAALEAAMQLIDGHDMEVWQYARKVAVQDHETKLPKKD